MTDILLSDIYIYPVKSLAGICVSRWPIVETGLRYDRKWMLIDTEQHFLSQRHLPRMALIKTALTESQLILSAPSMDDLHLSLEPTTGDIINSTIWHDQVDAIAVSTQADDWFSHFLDVECRLVYLPDTTTRSVNPSLPSPMTKPLFRTVSLFC
jgi:uncharacterized protein